MQNKKGFLIALEGGEGAGKTTQVKTLEAKLQAGGYEVLVVREPGGTQIGEQIRKVVLNPDNLQMADTTEALLYQASRAQLYAEVIIPALQKEQIVLMDRSSESSLVYQGLVRGFGVQKIDDLNSFSTQNVKADMIILMDVSVEVGFERMSEKNKDRLENAGKEFHEKVRNGYLKLAKENQGGRWQIIDAEKQVREVENEIWRLVSGFLKRK